MKGVKVISKEEAAEQLEEAAEQFRRDFPHGLQRDAVSADAPTPMPPVYTALYRLKHEVCDVQDEVRGLRQALTPVLAPAEPMGLDGPNQNDSEPPRLVEELHRIASAVGELKQALADIRERLEL
jgi:hypothetical protein